MPALVLVTRTVKDQTQIAISRNDVLITSITKQKTMAIEDITLQLGVRLTGLPRLRPANLGALERSSD